MVIYFILFYFGRWFNKQLVYLVRLQSFAVVLQWAQSAKDYFCCVSILFFCWEYRVLLVVMTIKVLISLAFLSMDVLSPSLSLCFVFLCSCVIGYKRYWYWDIGYCPVLAGIGWYWYWVSCSTSACDQYHGVCWSDKQYIYINYMLEYLPLYLLCLWNLIAIN